MLLPSSKNLQHYKKIISLIPSQTELLYHLGLDEEIIGITKFCIHPQRWFKTKTRVGGTKTVNLELVQQLKPDLIIANKEENEKAQIEILIKDFDVWLTDVTNLPEALLMISDIGYLTNRINEAGKLINKITYEFSFLKNTDSKIPAAYLIWQNPYMTVGGDTFINDMMERCGLKNIFAEKKRYPQITIEELQNSKCELIILSSEPYPFKQKNVDELQKKLPGKKVLIADGEMFSWYGSRLLKAPVYFKNLNAQF